MNRILEAETNSVHIRGRTNPFATRWTRPGAIPFQFPNQLTLDELVGRFNRCDWRGAILGPHGSGKSTLLATLLPAIEAKSKHVVLFQLHDRQRRLPLSRQRLNQLGPTDVIVIDGYEQLSRYERWRLLRNCRRRRCGLLVTSHNACGLPVLFRTEPSLSLIERLIERYLPPHADWISREEVEDAWRRHAANVREVFFDLYDRFEVRRPIVRITTELPPIVTSQAPGRFGTVISDT
jgi:hypothetical protein